MRTTVLLLAFMLTAASALSGCFGKDDESPGATDPTPETPTPASPSPASPTGGAGGNGTGETPPPPPPPKPADVNTTVTVQASAGITAVQPATGSGTFSVPATGWTSFTITVTPTSFSADSVRVSVTDPAGTEVATATINANTPPTTPPAAVTMDVAGTTEGEYTITASATTVSGGFSLDCLVSVTY